MGRFDISPEVAEEYRAKYRDTVAQQLGEERVIAVGPFKTTGGGTKYAISKTQAGALAYGAAHMLGKKKAGGLPGQFLLAVTPTKVYAFKYKSRRKGPEAREQVAVWERAGLAVQTERLQTTTRVTLTWASGDQLVCDQEGMGDNPWADDVVRELTVAG